MTAAKTHRALALFAVVAANFMIAIEATIVSTAMPRIVGQLGGLDLYSWVFASFLLAQTATTVVFGKLSDRIGRKKVILSGLAIFLVGSLLCGFAWSMPSMIAFRLIQGFGAGAILPTGMTIVGDLYPAHERGKVQGYLASVWALSGLLGPLAGGLIVQNISWAWVFWINIPLGLLAAALFMLHLHETLAHKGGKVEHLGAGLFALAIAAIMADLTAISTSNAREIAALTFLAAVSAGALVWQERRAVEPMISLELWGRRPIAAANAASLLVGMIMVGLTTFLPVYVQGVMGQSALAAGFALSAMVVGWPIGATISPRLWKRVGTQPVLRAGAAMIPVGALFFLFLRPDSSPLVAGVGSFIIGLGMGFLSGSSIVLIQEIVSWSERGSVTASYLFARSLGSTFGATLFGAILNIGLRAAGFGGPEISEQLRRLLEGRGADAVAIAGLRDALAQSLHLTFVSMFAIALLVGLVAILVPPVVFAASRAPAE